MKEFLRKGENNMINKKLISFSLVITMVLSFGSNAFAMDKRVIEGTYKHVKSGNAYTYNETYFKEGVSDGWYSEDGMWFYMENGIASNKARKLNGIMNYFRLDGSWIDTSSQEYKDYSDIIYKMREVKSNKDSSWSIISGRTILDKSYSYKLMDDYAETYLYPTDNLEETCFVFKGATLSLDTSSKYYNTEDKIRNTMNKLNVPDGSTDEQKVRLIHDFIVDNFDYDSSDFRKSAGSVSDAIANGGKLVCSGYTRLFMQLCNKYGLECVPIYGTGSGQNHTWNKVKVNGEWKYIDVTWDDNTSSDRWYLITESQMNSDHQPGKYIQ